MVPTSRRLSLPRPAWFKEVVMDEITLSQSCGTSFSSVSVARVAESIDLMRA